MIAFKGRSLQTSGLIGQSGAIFSHTTISRSSTARRLSMYKYKILKTFFLGGINVKRVRLSCIEISERQKIIVGDGNYGEEDIVAIGIDMDEDAQSFYCVASKEWRRDGKIYIVRRGDRDQALKRVIERDPTLSAAETIVAKAILVSISP
jgi:hypothetical protein